MGGWLDNMEEELRELQEETARQREALEILADRSRYDESSTGRVIWLHTDGKTKPWEIAQKALDG